MVSEKIRNSGAQDSNWTKPKINIIIFTVKHSGPLLLGQEHTQKKVLALVAYQKDEK